MIRGLRVNKGSIFVTANEARRLLFLAALGLHHEIYRYSRHPDGPNELKKKLLKIYWNATEKRILQRLKLSSEAERISWQEHAEALLNLEVATKEELKKNGGRTSPNYQRTAKGLRTIKRRLAGERTVRSGQRS